MTDNAMFKREWIIPYKPSRWLRFRLWLFGKPYIAVDLAREGDTTVKWKVLDGQVHILEIINHE